MVYPMKVLACLTVRKGQNEVALYSVVMHHYNAMHNLLVVPAIKHAHTILGSSVAIDTVSTSKT